MEFLFSLIQDILSYSQDNYFISILAFSFFLICYSVFSLPGILILTCMSGYLFGIYYGFIISILSVTFGSLIFFTSVIIGNRIKNIQLIKGITGQDLFTWDIVLIISVLILFLILKIKFKKNN